MTDKILDFNKEYNKDIFKWEESSLYSFLCEYYGICDVLIETFAGMVLVKKYNVVGYVEGNPYITVYESIGELDKVNWVVYLDTIHTIEVLL